MCTLCVSAAGRLWRIYYIRHPWHRIVRSGLRPGIVLHRAFRPPARHCVASCVPASGHACCVVRFGHRPSIVLRRACLRFAIALCFCIVFLHVASCVSASGHACCAVRFGHRPSIVLRRACLRFAIALCFGIVFLHCVVSCVSASGHACCVVRFGHRPSIVFRRACLRFGIAFTLNFVLSAATTSQSFFRPKFLGFELGSPFRPGAFFLHGRVARRNAAS